MENKALYAVSMMATNQRRGVAQHRVWSVWATSEAEAVGMGTERAKAAYPVADGWGRHPM